MIARTRLRASSSDSLYQVLKTFIALCPDILKGCLFSADGLVEGGELKANKEIPHGEVAESSSSKEWGTALLFLLESEGHESKTVIANLLNHCQTDKVRWAYFDFQELDRAKPMYSTVLTSSGSSAEA